MVNETMMTARQVAELLGVHENWVYDQAVSGVLPSYKIGGTRRFLPEELRGWIDEHRQPSRSTARGGTQSRIVPRPASESSRAEQSRLFD